MISWRKGLATSEVINRRTFFHSFFLFSLFIFIKRGLRRRATRNVRDSNILSVVVPPPVAFRALILVFRCGNIRGIDVFVG